MSVVIIRMPDGRSWTPRFVKEINQEKCIGCEACRKICPKKCYTHETMTAESS